MAARARTPRGRTIAIGTSGPPHLSPAPPAPLAAAPTAPAADGWGTTHFTCPQAPRLGTLQQVAVVRIHATICRCAALALQQVAVVRIHATICRCGALAERMGTRVALVRIQPTRSNLDRSAA